MNNPLDEMPNESGRLSGTDILLKYAEFLLQRRMIIVVVILAIVIPQLVRLLFFAPPLFTAMTTILPEETVDASYGRNISSQLTSLIGGGVQGQTPFSLLFPEILRSRRIVEKVLFTKFQSEKTPSPRVLLDVMEIEGENIREKLQQGFEQLTNNVVQISRNAINGITTITVETRNPKLSADVANAFVKQLDEYSRKIYSSKTKDNKLFLELRLEETQVFLKKAEDELKAFREGNKRIENSPQLQLRQGRLIREVRVQEEVFLTLRKEYEIVKIEEVKSRPVVRVLDEAVEPVYKSSPKRVQIMIGTFVLALGIAISFALLLEYLTIISSNPERRKKIKGLMNILINDYQGIMSFLPNFKKRI